MDFNTIETSSDGEGNDVKPLEHSEEEKPHHHHSGGGGGGGDGASPGKIFIGGLAKETTPVQFTKHFGKYGEITDSVIMKDRVTGQPRGFGFVTYADPAVVDKVIDDTHVINGKQVEIKRTIPKGAIGSKDFKTKKIFVGGIPTSVTEDEFKDFFSKYGEVSEHQIMRDHATSRSRGFGFITFESEQSVDSLLSQGNKIDFSGTQVEIKKAEPKKSNPPLPPSKRFSNSRSSYGSEYGDAYGGYGGGGGGFGGSSYRSGGGYGGRPGGYAGYGASEYGGGPGGYGYGGSNLGSYRGGEPSLGYGSRYGGGYGRGYDLGGGAGGYGGGSEGYGGGYGGYGGGADVGYGSSYDSGFGSGGGYRGSGGSSAAPYGNRGGYGGSGTSRYHPYSR